MKAILFSFIMLTTFWCFGVDLTSHILREETTIQQYFKKYEFMPQKSNLDEIDCIYVLNLDERPEKWEYTSQQLEATNLKFNRFAGINGWKIPIPILTKFWEEQGVDPEDPPLIPGKLGCLLTHLSVLQDALDRGYQRIWVLQDDIDILDDPFLIDTYIRELNQIDPEWGLLYTDLDMVRDDHEPLRARCITGAYRENQQTLPELWYLIREDINQNFQKIRSRYGFHSVIVSRKGMELILDYFKHVVLQTFFDIDIQFIPPLHKYGLKKPLVSNSCNWGVSDSFNKFRELSDYPAPYNQLSKLSPFYDPESFDDEIYLCNLLQEYKPKIVVELGSSLGKSTRYIAHQIEKNGKVYTLGSWDQQMLNSTLSFYNQFLNNVIHHNLTEKIIPIKNTPIDATEEFDFLYINHIQSEKKTFKDIAYFYPRLKPFAILCGKIPPHFAKKLTRKYDLKTIFCSDDFYILQKLS